MKELLHLQFYQAQEKVEDQELYEFSNKLTSEVLNPIEKELGRDEVPQHRFACAA